MPANDRQVGGDHYQKLGPVQHWDLSALYQWDPMQYQIIKYTMRWRDKNGVADLQKVAHFVEKYIEDVVAGRMPGMGQWPLKPLNREHWLRVLDAVDAQPVLGGAPVATSDVTLDDWVRGYNARHGYSDDGGKLGDLYMVVRKDAVKSDGWRDFTFEGSKGGPDGEFDYFRCKHCLEHFGVPLRCPPTDHTCYEEVL